ncbi:RluA family pseudouridine synthase [Saccharicrinis carchari]|nr:RluA family pseudouridine synthase [Saccharicrinis carchari]
MANCFTYFTENTAHIELPQKFTYPFYYEPHPLCVLAANQLQHHLLTQTDWQHDFGLDHYVEGTNIGKMFGVLVVQKQNGELGFLSAFSGKLADTNHLPGFVPPIYDLLKKDGFFRKEEDRISCINQQIEALENETDFLIWKQKCIRDKSQCEKELKAYRQLMKTAKNERKQRRNTALHKMGQSDFDLLAEKLKQESLKQQFDYKVLRKHWNEKLNHNQKKLDGFNEKIKVLKEERKVRSAALQQKLFDQYQFLNKKGETIGVGEIFARTTQKVPPAGAGDCAAPKLLQFAFTNQLKPLALAEFWWGQSPRSEIRRHKNFYPSCRGKCEPILGHMLAGITMDENPIKSPTAKDDDLKIIFEDEYIAVINKPAGFLSVPGKATEDSVYLRMQKKFPHATGPLLVHRLDMSTSGLILMAKDKDIHKNLQQQFLERTVQKRYVALLDGIIARDEGFIDLPLRVDLQDRPRQLVCYQHGKAAKTKFKVIGHIEGKTKIHFFPITGRTHQLRVHAAHPQGLGTPIVGDDLYGNKNTRLFLHAEYLAFRHPVSDKAIKVMANPDF